MASLFSVADLLDMLRRRIWVILGVAVLGSLFSVVFALQQPQTYSSTAVIQVTMPKIAGELAKSTVGGSSARRIQLIEQRLMSRGTLLEIADQLQLFADRPSLLDSEIVPIMRESISLRGTAAAQEGQTDDGTISVLTITAYMGSAAQAQAVAAEFARRTIELSLATRMDQARETLTFFTQKEAALTRDISALQEEMSQYRVDQGVSQPGLIQMRSIEIASINETLLTLSRQEIELRTAGEEAAATQREAYARRVQTENEATLETIEAQRSLLESRRAALEASIEVTPEVNRQLAAYERRLDQMQTELETITVRRSEAEVGFRLEAADQGERLTVLEPATLPDYPDGSGRKGIAIKGGVLSLVLGFFIGFALDLRHPVLRSSAQMLRETGLSPVVTIPTLETEQPSRLARLFRRANRDAKGEQEV
ncbi:Wzz/FepE/Etk N-terminal domain-containing protein [Arenibacterium sp. LLYu02]|uniref:Wzz/FepE/Etk N-terminal domain-containing protein n=1 Tax=Arenibacterium sp. LLYu02 TaxID=3404132 RepID=UPI003B216B39